MNSIEPEISKGRSDFAHRLLRWYARHARAMPWRVPPHEHAQGVRADPYRVWLSEVMLQQTQVATVKEYFLKFTAKWPTVGDLAGAEEEDVLKAWAGLGYYSRARNLKKCADLVANEHDGFFPGTYQALIKLPGIGDYTASAIAAIAFDQPVVVMDGNVERVMARHRRIETPFPDAKPETREHLREVRDQDLPGEFAQAMMDLGATICTPKRPACALCPVNEDCTGFKAGDAETYPRKKPKPEKPVRKGAAFVLENSNGEIFLCKRGDKGLLASMTQVPTTNWTARENGATGVSAAPVNADWHLKGTARHTFTHFHLELEVWHAVVDTAPEIPGWWCGQDTLDNEALPTVMNKVLGIGLG